MAKLSKAEVLARELNSQAKQHPRVSILLVPNVKVNDNETVIDIYWMDRASPFCSDAIIRFDDYAHQPVEEAAKQILDQLAKDLDEDLAAAKPGSTEGLVGFRRGRPPK